MRIDQHKFNHDLTSTLHMCNIPSNKLDQQPFKEFIHKYTGYHIPSRKKFQKCIYSKNIFDITINKIRNIIENNYIWVPLIRQQI